MFLFYDSEQEEKNASYYKGVLFEKLLSDYLKANGYTIQIRQKYNSLEYDLEGNDKNTNMQVIGEAKAYQTPISGQILAAFVGKILPLGLIEKKVHGLFFSTSPLTPEAKNYYKSIQIMGVTVHSGEDLFLKILESLNLPSKHQVFQKTKELQYNPLFDFILTTNYGYKKLVIASNLGAMTPSHFLVFDSNLNLIHDEKALKSYSFIKDLRGLAYVCGKPTTQSPLVTRQIQKGLLIGQDWSDYRLPAGPEYFVGRKELANQITNYIKSDDVESRLIQIKSRSGVGKSSLLSLLSSHLNTSDYSVELHDARDIKTVVDVFSVIGRFLNTNHLPQDFSEVQSQLTDLPRQKKYIFMVDQFESTFLNPDVFTAYETLAKIVCSLKCNIYFCLARKNDQLTTYDDSLISISQLNSLSKNYELKDFTIEEARELLDKINSTSTKKISKEVLGYILEFSQGFPWLLKRTMFHIIKLTNNVSQKQLIDTGLMLDDLFEEELEGLEEIEKEYLSKVCAKLPADFHQLQSIFEEDILLPKMLDKFTESRLLRLTGTTYDTYNDVFKEYLVYQKLPEFRHKHIFRKHPNSVTNFFAKIVFRDKFTITQLSKSLKISERSLSNSIKECRNLGLLKKDDEYWVVPKNIRDIYNQGHLGVHLRQQIMNNEFVIEILKKASIGTVDIENIPVIMNGISPYVEASELTWKLYTNTLLAWMSATKIIIKENSTKIQLCNNEELNLASDLGNLLNSEYGRKSRSSLKLQFVPTCTWKLYEDFYNKHSQGITDLNNEEKKAKRDLKSINMLESLHLYKTLEDFKAVMITKYFNSELYIKIWSAAKNETNILIPVAELIHTEITPTTLLWRAKKIISCGKSLGLIERKRYLYEGKNNSSK